MFRKKGAGDWKLSVEHAEKVPSLPIIGHALRNDLQTGPSNRPSIFAQEQQVESREWDSKQRSVLAVRWNADGHYCLSCGKDSTIKLWNPFKSTCVALFSGHGRDVTDVDCAGDSEHFVSSSVLSTSRCSYGMCPTLRLCVAFVATLDGLTASS